MLHGRQLPCIGPHGTGEGPVFLELNGIGAVAGDHFPAFLIDGIIQQIGVKTNGNIFLADFRPRFSNLSLQKSDIFHFVLLAASPQVVQFLFPCLHQLGAA